MRNDDLSFSNKNQCDSTAFAVDKQKDHETLSGKYDDELLAQSM